LFLRLRSSLYIELYFWVHCEAYVELKAVGVSFHHDDGLLEQRVEVWCEEHHEGEEQSFEGRHGGLVLQHQTQQKTRPIMVSPEATIAETCNIFSREKLHRVYVVNEHGTLLGVISIIDILELLSQHGL